MCRDPRTGRRAATRRHSPPRAGCVGCAHAPSTSASVGRPTRTLRAYRATREPCSGSVRGVRYHENRALLLLLLAGCANQPTQALVSVETTLIATDGMASLRISTSVAAQSRSLSARAGDLPLSFAILPEGGDTTRVADVQVEALDASGNVLVARSTRVPFTNAAVTAVSLCLDRRCLRTTCPAGQTCRSASSGGAPACMSVDLAPTESCGLADAGP